MVSSAQTREWSGISRRRVPRFEVRAPLDVTVVRSGVPDTLPGRALNVCERGVAAMLAGELMAGEVVGVEIRLPLEADPLRTRALVRYQDKLRCGMEFLGLTAQQRGTIREWSREAVEPETTHGPATGDRVRQAAPEGSIAKVDFLKSDILKSDFAKNKSDTSATISGGNASLGAWSGNQKKKRPGMGWVISCALLLLAILGSGALTGCASGPKTPAGTYSIEITAASNSITQQATFSLTVQ